MRIPNHPELFEQKVLVTKGNPKYGACLSVSGMTVMLCASVFNASHQGDYQCNNAMMIFKEHGSGRTPTISAVCKVVYVAQEWYAVII